MNNDLISREDLKKAICIDEPISIDETWEQLYDAVVKAIDNAPTVETGHYLTNCANCERVAKIRAKRARGKWLFKEITEDYKVYGQCSICKHRKRIDNYCPNCGAKMDGKEADNEEDNM